jgi:hypothetical protein
MILSLLWVIFQLAMFQAVLWGMYELFFGGYWKFICFGIEKGYIQEDIFAHIEKMQKMASFGMF